MKPYIYIAVRKDLSSSQQVVQSSHAAIESSRHFLSKEDIHPSVIVVGVKNEYQLKKLRDSLPVKYQDFREPDIGNELTAFATEPIYGDDRKLFKRYNLL